MFKSSAFRFSRNNVKMHLAISVTTLLPLLVIILADSAAADDCPDLALRRIATDVHTEQRVSDPSRAVAEIHRRLTTDLATNGRGAWTVISGGRYSVPHYGNECKLRLGQTNYAIYLTSKSNHRRRS